MKRILLLCFAVCLSQLMYAQPYVIPSGTLANNTVFSDPASGFTSTQVSSTVTRNQKVTYNHLTPTFAVQTGWLTGFTPDIPGDYGKDSTNADYFLFDGENFITNSGGNAVIIFDTVHFNNGATNKMTINSYNEGLFSPDGDFGQCPGSIIVTRRLAFNNGITSTNRSFAVNGAIVFSNNASYTGGNTDAQHVDGFVSEVNYVANASAFGHDGDFTFPVGNSTASYSLRRQGVFNSTEHILTVAWIDGDPDVTPDPTVTLGSASQLNSRDEIDPSSGIAAVHPVGFWDWHYQLRSDANFSPTSLPNAQTITVELPDLSGLPIAASELRLVGWDYTNGWWVNLSGTSGAGGLTHGSLLTGTIPGDKTISALAIGSTNVALPVTFGQFKVTAAGCKALLHWQTSFELNNNYFKVERSANGRDFISIAQVASAGNGTILRNYSYTDLAPLEGVNYYRITQVDFDGKQTSTEVLATRIQCNGLVQVKVFPNPARQQINVLTGKSVAQVNIINAGGQQVVKVVPSVNNGGTFSVGISNITSGMYFLQVINKDGSTDLVKFFKE